MHLFRIWTMQKDFQLIGILPRGELAVVADNTCQRFLVQLESGTEGGGMTWRFESSVPVCPIPSDFHTIQLNYKH